MSTGYGPRGQIAATSQATSNRQFASSATFTNARNSSTLPPGTGRGTGSIPAGRRNLTGEFETMRQPVFVTSTASHSPFARSRYVAPFCSATRTKTAPSTPSMIALPARVFTASWRACALGTALVARKKRCVSQSLKPRLRTGQVS